MGVPGHACHVGPDNPTPPQIAPNPSNPSSSSRHPSTFSTLETSFSASLAPHPHHWSRSTVVDVFHSVPDHRNGDTICLDHRHPFLHRVLHDEECYRKLRRCPQRERVAVAAVQGGVYMLEEMSPLPCTVPRTSSTRAPSRRLRRPTPFGRRRIQGPARPFQIAFFDEHAKKWLAEKKKEINDRRAQEATRAAAAADHATRMHAKLTAQAEHHKLAEQATWMVAFGR